MSSSQSELSLPEVVVGEEGERSGQGSFLDPQVLALTAIFVAIVAGNLPVVITIIFGRLGRTRMYYFLLHLCFADLITGCFNVIPQLAWEMTRHFYGGNFLCKTVKYLQILGPYLSSYTLTVMSIDRYLAICHPLTNNHLSLDRAKKSIAVAWILSLLFCIPQAFIFSHMVINDQTGEKNCWATFLWPPWGVKLYVTWYAFSVFIVPFFIIFFTHLKICCELWKTSKERRLTHKARKTHRNPSSDDESTIYSPGGVKKTTRFRFPTLNIHHHHHHQNSKHPLHEAQPPSSSHHNHHPNICLGNESEAIAVKQSLLSPPNPAVDPVTTTSIRHEGEHDDIGNYQHHHHHVNLNHTYEYHDVESREQQQQQQQGQLHLHHNQLSEETCDDLTSPPSSKSSGKNVNVTFSPIPMGAGTTTSLNFSASSRNPREFLHVQGINRCGLIPSSEEETVPAAATSSSSHMTPSQGDDAGSSLQVQQQHQPGESSGRVSNSLLSPTPSWHVSRSSSTIDRRRESSVCHQLSPLAPTMAINRCVSQEEEHLRAKIKSVKLTVTVILCYVFCSLPFICVQLWANWYPGAQQSSAWTGTMVMIVMRLSSLNSCVNPWIYLTFNTKLYTALRQLFLCSKYSDNNNYDGGGPSSGDMRSC